MNELECGRYIVRQLGKPALLAATYKGDAAGIAAAAMEEVEFTLVSCLHELERLSFISGGEASSSETYDARVLGSHTKDRRQIDEEMRRGSGRSWRGGWVGGGGSF